MNRTSLCLQMLMLLKARGKMNTKELASALETNPRNIREFKKDLITAGYNIQEQKGRYGGYYLDENCLFPSLRLSEAEISALNESSQIIVEQRFDRTNDYLRAIDKVLSSTRNNEVAKRIYINSNSSSLSSKEKVILEKVQQAIDDNHCLKIEYRTRDNSRAESYLIDPYEIMHYQGAYYILAFSHKRNDYRTYRVSPYRMLQCEIDTRSFLRDNTFHVEQHIGKNSIFKGSFTRVKVKVDIEIENIFLEEFWGNDFKKEKPLEYSFLVEDRYLFFKQLFSYQERVKILEPESLKQDYIRQIETILRNYQ